MITKIVLSAKCDDRCDTKFHSDGSPRREIVGNVPYGMKLGGGDYVTLQIDNATGQIIGWVPITEDQMIEAGALA